MELTPALSKVKLKDTCRLIPSRYPVIGILDMVASPDDLQIMFELEAWTNDRISAELGIIRHIAPEEWVTARPMATVIMASFCHPGLEGSRFNGPDRGAWYAALNLATAHREIIHHRTEELAEIGISEARVQVRLYLADFQSAFHDIRPAIPENEPYHRTDSYEASQVLSRELLELGSNGILYRSVRSTGGECIACFRPTLVLNVRPGAHFEYRWHGTREPKVRKLA